DLCPSTTRAASRPASFRSSVALACRSWFAAHWCRFCHAFRFAAQHHPVVPPQSYRAQSPLTEVVVDHQIAPFEVAAQSLPVARRVADRLTQSRLRQRPELLLVQPLLQLVEDRPRLLLARLLAPLLPLAALLLRQRVVGGWK